MKFISFARMVAACAVAVAAFAALSACKKDLVSPGATTEDYYPIINVNTWTVAASYATGATVTLELQFASYGTIKEIGTYQIANRSGKLDTTQVSATAYKPAFSTTKQCDTLLLSYVVPNIVPRPTNVRVMAQVLNQNGLFKNRASNTFTIK